MRTMHVISDVSMMIGRPVGRGSNNVIIEMSPDLESPEGEKKLLQLGRCEVMQMSASGPGQIELALFAGSLRAGQRAANIMSLIQSAKLNGHDPYRYLKDVLARLPTQPAGRLEELLPHRWEPQVVIRKL